MRNVLKFLAAKSFSATKFMEKSGEKIDISVIIPAHNEEELLPFCLKSLEAQNFSGVYEIILVDNASTDRTSQVAEEFGVKIVYEGRKGIAYARQKGASAAHGDILAFTDADTILPPDWLENIQQSFNTHPDIIGVTGKMYFFGQSKKLPILINVLAPLFYYLCRLISRGHYFIGPNFAIRHDILEKIGGFNTKLAIGEDNDVASRAKRFGKIYFNKNLWVTTSTRRWEHGSSSLGGVKNLLNLYFLNFIWYFVFKKPRVNEFYDVRRGGDYYFITKDAIAKIRLFAYSLFVFMVLIAIVVIGVFSPSSQVFGKNYWREKTSQKIVALTFDDGPNEPYTSEILDILAKYKIKATFFVVGENALYYPETTKRILREGHVIGDHSYSHPFLFINKKSTIEQEITLAQNAIYSVTGKYPRLFRPPHGFKSPWLMSAVKQSGLVVVEWSDITRDWAQPGEKNITERIIQKIERGSIIVLHDGDQTRHGSDRSQEVEALPQIIEELKNKGYQFVTVPELLGINAYNN